MIRYSMVRSFALLALCGLLSAQTPRPVYRVTEEHVPLDVTPLLALDVDQDGDADIVAKEGVLLNDGSGLFTANAGGPPTLATAALASALSNAVGAIGSHAKADLDGDGFDDLVISSFTALGETPFAFRSTSIGLVPMAITFPPGSPTRFAAFDYDSDGLDDLVVTGNLLAPSIWHNQSAQSFVPATIIGPQLLQSFIRPAVGDFDGDGDLDAFIVSAATSGLGSFLLYSAGNFTATPVVIPTPVLLTADLVAGDFDADGVADVVLRGGFGASCLHFGLRCVSGVPTVTSTPLSSICAVSSLVVVELNSDLTPEFAVSYYTGNGSRGIQVFSGLPGTASAAAAPTLSITDGIGILFAFDADGDGDDDLLCQRAARTSRVLYSDGAYGLYEARGDLSFALTEPSGSPMETDVVVGDYDGDGDADVARRYSALCSASPFLVLSNDGHGRFPVASATTACMLLTAAKVLAADFDGDGRDDIFRMWTQTPAVGVASVHLSLPTGGFSNTTVAVEPGVATDFVVADLDQDGDPDVAACLSAPNRLVRYVNQGQGVFWAFTLSLPASPTEIRVVDMNADGAVDFVLATASGVQLVDGATLALSTLVPLTTAARIEVGDLDGDLNLDLLLNGVPWVKVGSSYVAQPPLTGFPTPITGPALPQALFDADGDGDLDVLAYGALWRGGIGATFIGPEPVTFPAILAQQIAETGFMSFYRFGDFDRDGDIDLLDPTGRLLSNVSRHLSRGRPAAVGRTASLVVDAPSLQPVQLFASPTAFAQTPLFAAGFGNVFLVPSAAVFIGTFLFNDGAAAEISFDVPAAPALVGLDLYWQAVLPTAAKITNVERTTILAL